MKKLINFLLCSLCIIGCGGVEPTPIDPTPTPPTPTPPSTEEVPVSLQTRAASGDFVKGDAIGIYMSNQVEGVHSPLKSSGNYIDNWRFEYDGNGGWSAGQKLYYKDEETAADFYAYYPYSTVSDATRYDVSVSADQSQESVYQNADFLWGSALACKPTTAPVEITLNHMMSKAVIILKPGTGFSEEELVAVNPSVILRGLNCEASFNLGTGELRSGNSVSDITPYHYSSLEYRAMVVPQEINDKDMVVIAIGESVYKLRRTISFEKGKEYTFTVTIQRTEGGVSVGIGSWDVVGEDFGGVVS